MQPISASSQLKSELTLLNAQGRQLRGRAACFAKLHGLASFDLPIAAILQMFATLCAKPCGFCLSRIASLLDLELILAIDCAETRNNNKSATITLIAATALSPRAAQIHVARVSLEVSAFLLLLGLSPLAPLRRVSSMGQQQVYKTANGECPRLSQ